MYNQKTREDTTMKKIIGFIIATVLLSVAISTGTADAASANTTFDQVETISPKKDTNTSIKLKTDVPVFELNNGVFKPSGLKAAKDSNWTVGDQVLSNSGLTYYQLNGNNYVQANLANLQLIISSPIMIQQ
jgi:hypothetical protein